MKVGAQHTESPTSWDSEPSRTKQVLVSCRFFFYRTIKGEFSWPSQLWVWIWRGNLSLGCCKSLSPGSHFCVLSNGSVAIPTEILAAVTSRGFEAKTKG